jgi:hypothetical protein
MGAFEIDRIREGASRGAEMIRNRRRVGYPANRRRKSENV